MKRTSINRKKILLPKLYVNVAFCKIWKFLVNLKSNLYKAENVKFCKMLHFLPSLTISTKCKFFNVAKMPMSCLVNLGENLSKFTNKYNMVENTFPAFF